MIRNTTRNASVVWLVLKSLLAFVLAMGILSIVCFYGFFALYAIDNKMVNYDINMCEEYYQRRDFVLLCDYMDDYGVAGDELDKYTEAVEGANLRSRYLQWSAAAEQGMDGADQTAQDILAQLKDLADNSQFPENREIFTEFLRELTDS